MRRVLRFIGLGLAGLSALAALGVAVLGLLIALEAMPRNHRAVWVDGPGGTRSRGDSWVEDGSWIDDPSERPHYTEVIRLGADTPIGLGPAALDSPGSSRRNSG